MMILPKSRWLTMIVSFTLVLGTILGSSPAIAYATGEQIAESNVSAEATTSLQLDAVGETEGADTGESSDLVPEAGGGNGQPLTDISVITPATPTISGTAEVGSELTVHEGPWAPEDVTFSYQWLRGEEAIPGATLSTYTVVTEDASARLSVEVTASKPGQAPVVESSEPTVIFQDLSPETAGAVQKVVTGADITRNDSATSESNSMQLVLGGSFSGKVTGPDGTPVSGAGVYASIGGGGGGGSAVSAEDGTYTVTGLPAGDYTVSVRGPYGSNLVTAYYGGDSSQFAERLAVSAGAALENIDVQLVLGGSFSGKVTGPDGTPVSGAGVYASMGGGGGGGSAVSAEDGTYTITGLPAGDYTVYVIGPYGSNLLSAYYGGGSYQSAKTVTVSVGATVPKIDVQLDLGGSFSGKVTGPDGTPVSGARVNAVTVAGNFQTGVQSAADGTYTITGLPAGDYTVSASGPYGSNLVTAYYGGDSSQSAERLTVGAGVALENINIELGLGGTVVGVVLGPDEVPLSQIFLELFSATTGDSVGYVITDSDGAFTVSAVPAGVVRIFGGGLSGDVRYKRTWFGGADFGSATDLTVSSGSVTNAGSLVLQTVVQDVHVSAPQIQLNDNPDGSKELLVQEPIGLAEPALGIQYESSGVFSGGGTGRIFALDTFPISIQRSSGASMSTRTAVAWLTASGESQPAVVFDNRDTDLDAPVLRAEATADSITVFATAALGSDSGNTWQFFLEDGSGRSERIQGTGSSSANVTFSGLSEGEEYSVSVAAGNSQAQTQWASISAITSATQGVLTKTPTPTISGTVRAGQVLTAVPGVWDEGVSLSYRWLRDGEMIPGATASTYSLVSADVGAKITVRVTGEKAGYVSVTKTSSPTRAVEGPLPVNGAAVAKDPLGNGVNGVKVNIRKGGCDVSGPGVWENTTATSQWSTGGFGVSLEPGAYCVTTLSVPNAYVVPAPFEVSYGAASPWITVWLSPNPDAPKPAVNGAAVAKDPLGNGVNGVKVNIRKGGCDVSGPGVWENTTATSQWSTGGFGVSLEPGAYCVTTLSVPNAYVVPAPFEVSYGAASPWITVWLSPASR